MPLTVDVASIIDGAAVGRVLVVGALPPAGRDYDLFASDSDRSALADALCAHGFRPIEHRWVRFGTGDPEVVELMTRADWGISGREADALFGDALPLPGRARLCVPAPAHQLLILAHKLAHRPGLLEPRHRQRVRDALSREPEAWAQARVRAAEWGVEQRLRALESRSGRLRRPRWPPRWLRRPRRGAVIALSGLDGVGKSTQAQALRATLTKLGYETTVQWAPIGSNPALRHFASVSKRALAHLPFGPLADADGDAVDRRLLSHTSEDARGHSRPRKLAASTWSMVTTLANAASYRRSARGTLIGGRVVIFDRYVLDSIVDLRFSYAPDGRLPVHEGLIRLLAPTPRLTFLLDASPETAHARKPDWSLAQTRLRAGLYERERLCHGVHSLDATQPAHELTAQIAVEVLRTLAR